jgi:hypothetical protein
MKAEPMSNIGAIAGAIAALDELLALAGRTDRLKREIPSRIFKPLNNAEIEHFRQLDDAVCLGCIEAGITQPDVESHASGVQALGFTRFQFLQGRIPQPSRRWYEAMRTLRLRLHAKLASCEAPIVPQLEAIMLELNKAQKLMFRELWEKGSATFERLCELRGSRLVAPDAERKAIDRLADKVSEITNRKVRIEKQAGGVQLVK